MLQTKEYPKILEISNEEYHASEGLSKSNLDKFAQSPATYFYNKQNPEPPTPAMEMGTLVHTAILEFDKLDERYAVGVECDRRTKEGKALWAKFQEDNQGKKIITSEDYNTALAMRESVLANPKAKKLLDSAEVEQSYYWIDKRTGVLCKCRPDAVNLGYLIDIKSTTDASINAFMRSAHNFRYHNQSAWYSDGYYEVSGNNPKGFIFIVVEKKPPYQVALYVAEDLFTEAGRQENNMLLTQFAECQKNNNWYSYGGKENNIMTLTLPKWAYSEYDL